MRSAIEALAPYRVKRNEGFTLLDNNENFLNLLSYVTLEDLKQKIAINRYPSDNVERLIEAYADYAGLPAKNILAGNGSDEWISLISQFALDPNDRVIVVEPDFSMYEKNALIMGAKVTTIPLNKDFSLPLNEMIQKIEELKPKCLFISNPCNPTGRYYTEREMDVLSSAMKGVGGYFILDEAYIEFAGASYADRAIDESHVIVLRTASKALGMAGLRLGFLIANEQLIEDISRIKPPYNVNQLSAVLGTALLERRDLLQASLNEQKHQIDELESILEDFANQNDGITVHPSRTNFFLVETEQAKALYEFLNERKIRIRYFGKGRLVNGLRISAGTKEEMESLRNSLTKWSQK
ncbi:MAG: pyridoxal phosphate-dependent aminotransferase [Tuberibacillus sp.]